MQAVAGVEADPVAADLADVPKVAAGRPLDGGGGDVGRVLRGEKSFGWDPPEGAFQEFLGLGDLRRVLARRRVEHHAIGADDTRHVLRGLHPSLDLQGVDPCIHQVRDHLDAGEIVGRKVVPFLPLVFILAPAGLRAAPPVAAVAAEEGGEEALSRDGEAESAVDEAFDLGVAGGDDVLYLVDVQFAGEHHALEA